MNVQTVVMTAQSVPQVQHKTCINKPSQPEQSDPNDRPSGDDSDVTPANVNEMEIVLSPDSSKDSLYMYNGYRCYERNSQDWLQDEDN